MINFIKKAQQLLSSYPNLLLKYHIIDVIIFVQKSRKQPTEQQLHKSYMRHLKNKRKVNMRHFKVNLALYQYIKTKVSSLPDRYYKTLRQTL